MYNASQLSLVLFTAFLRPSVQGGLVECLRGLRHIQSRILGEETIRLKHARNLFHGHDWEVFSAGVMRETECCRNNNNQSGFTLLRETTTYYAK